MPSGWEPIVRLRAEILKGRLGPGFLMKQLQEVRGVAFFDAVYLPLAYDAVYVGSGASHIHPSPWSSPFAHSAEDEETAKQQYREYAHQRADVREWLAPLCGKQLVAESGIAGCHALVLEEFVKIVAEETKKTHHPHPLHHLRQPTWMTQTTCSLPTPTTSSSYLSLVTGPFARRCRGATEMLSARRRGVWGKAVGQGW